MKPIGNMVSASQLATRNLFVFHRINIPITPIQSIHIQKTCLEAVTEQNKRIKNYLT